MGGHISIQHHVIFLPGTLCDKRVFASQCAALENAGVTYDLLDYQALDTLADIAVLVHQAFAVKQAKVKCGIQMSRTPLEAPVLVISLVAFSMGAMVAFEVLKRYPDIVDSLVLIDANAHSDGEGKAALRAEHLQQAKQSGLASLIQDTYMPNYLFAQTPKHIALIISMAQDLGVEVFAAQLTILANRPDASSVLLDLKIPVLIIGGENDLLCPPSEQQRMFALCSGSVNKQLISIPSCGHFATLEQADTVNHILLTWFQQVH